MSFRDKPPEFHLQDNPIDQSREIRAIIIGAGISGIALYIRLLQHIPNIRVTILDKNPEVGGTWYENRYPGVACDIPSHVYQYTFEPNIQWSKYFAPGPEIQEYVKGVAKKYKVDQKVRYNTKVIGATWNDDAGTWTVNTEHKTPDCASTTGKLEAEVLISAVGILNNWKWPDIAGLQDFEGKLQHSANWDNSWDYTNKKMALIGCGSSAIQILPRLQKQCSEVYNFVRGGTWISQPFGSSFTAAALAASSEPGNYTYTPEELRKFASDPNHYKAFRKAMEGAINGDYPCLFPGSPEEKAGTQGIRLNMKTKLATRPGLYEALEPSFVPGCRRLTPGPGYLEALTKDNVYFIKTPIAKVLKNSIITTDGKEWEVDGIACATGFDTSYMPRFPIIGRHGLQLSDEWAEHASAYLSLSVPGFPNYFVVGGPNSATGGGSLLLILESIINYVTKAVTKISREHIKSMEVKSSTLASWQAYLDSYFPQTVHVDNCTSWYKVNGKIIGLWPGSSLHAKNTLEHPRWEDYEYENLPDHDPLEWLGNGWTIADRDRSDLSFYLDNVDVPPIPSDELLARQP
ncbi:Flavin-containing monooxygenase, partial [Scytalidium lignicola]